MENNITNIISGSVIIKRIVILFPYKSSLLWHTKHFFLPNFNTIISSFESNKQRLLNIFRPCSYCSFYLHGVCFIFYIPSFHTSVMMESNKIHIIYGVTDFLTQEWTFPFPSTSFLNITIFRACNSSQRQCRI